MTDADAHIDPEPHSSLGSPAPQTPPGKARAEHDHYDGATPRTTPPASPSFSLHSLGISPLSPLRRLSPSPLARSASRAASPFSDAEPSEQEDDIIEDSRDVLVQRLRDLEAALRKRRNLQEENLNQLHRKMSEMENAMTAADRQPKPRSQRSRPASFALDSRGERESFRDPSTPSPLRSAFPNMPSSAQSSSLSKASEAARNIERKGSAKGPKMSAAQAERVVEESQKLCKEMEEVITNLRLRREETEHIHELLIMRAERAAQRIIQLEGQVGELERERNEGEMEMLNLQIQLKAIEVQCLSYVPKDADEDLRESISAWKTEWSALKRKRARKDRGTPGTPTRAPRSTATPD
ncbi:hypothetical protein F5B20DRAFT_359417 [Whalleya microplaca]|nr:hypothetical protein F5B20DRAFT_359417 [Whalleya microplaca]